MPFEYPHTVNGYHVNVYRRMAASAKPRALLIAMNIPLLAIWKIKKCANPPTIAIQYVTMSFHNIIILYVYHEI